MFVYLLIVVGFLLNGDRWQHQRTENRAGPSNLGTVFSQIILCKQLAPDFNAEELRSIRKDSEDLQRLIDDLSEFMPMEESYGTTQVPIDFLSPSFGCVLYLDSLYTKRRLK